MAIVTRIRRLFQPMNARTTKTYFPLTRKVVLKTTLVENVKYFGPGVVSMSWKHNFDYRQIGNVKSYLTEDLYP